MSRSFSRALAAFALAGTTAANAQSLSVDLEVPRLRVAEYHRPYIALWVAREDNSVAANLAVLYDVAMADEEGEKWLKDMRQWWRRTGRSLSLPVDGLSGATRGPGRHEFVFSDKLADLQPGQYRLLVEAAREVGGREMLEIPFQWPPAQGSEQRVAGGQELGEVVLTLQPRTP
ncbi:DUF2271 domain-containing protein [Parahaliea mediterranea]|uniref:DUF2271 domain-containing protein n=1 Tax=Parahaliea mediterranea TaxID=651086 RepID=A0A939INF7_9GAMM|nr:DUF2271 domain-containing protein [Parahaliea mediterranea]MBN7798078.1 DUF2271 domain-containing protein [Parahaliea mediterranea]